MPRKRTQSAIAKSERSPEEKEVARDRSRHLADRRYRRKLRRDAPEKARERMAKRRAEMTEEQKAAAKEKRKQYDSKYYLTHRQDILHAAMRKRAQ
ncbi:hypothetical protein VKT23_019397 [Stygiomarasmius scandens]|uniref:Uncharacterized protein n=1 Tax=Marasmiellus scandens TaxID=2682957 RepID=A0ABR1ILD9_9AGAR